MKPLLFLVTFFLCKDLLVFAMPNCGRSFCFGNGRCEHSSSGTWYCRCDESFHGSQCQFKKMSYVAELNISQIIMPNASYEGHKIFEELSNRYSNVYASTRNLTDHFFQKALSIVRSYIRGVFSIRRNNTILFKMEFSEISEVSLVTLRKLVFIALNNNQYTVRSSKAHRNYSLHFNAISIRDFDECTEIPADACTKYRSCQNIIGSFSCDCKDGYLDMSGECVKVSKEEFDWRQISIWVGIVVVILIWMFAAIYCTARRRYIKRRKSNTAQRLQSQTCKDLNNHRQSNDSRASSENSRKISLVSNASVSYMDSPKNLTAHARVRSHSDTSLSSFPSSRTINSEVDVNSVFGSPVPSRPTRLHYNYMQNSLPDISAAQIPNAHRGLYFNSRHSSLGSSLSIEDPLRKRETKPSFGSLPILDDSPNKQMQDSNRQNSIEVEENVTKQPNIVVTTPGASQSHESNSRTAFGYPTPDY